MYIDVRALRVKSAKFAGEQFSIRIHNESLYSFVFSSLQEKFPRYHLKF